MYQMGFQIYGLFEMEPSISRFVNFSFKYLGSFYTSKVPNHFLQEASL